MVSAHTTETLIQLGDGTFIGTTKAELRVRGVGYGSNAWLARITGPHATFNLEREFLYPDRSGLYVFGHCGYISWEIKEPGLYEIRNFCVGSTHTYWRRHGFFLIKDGAVSELDRNAALELSTKIGLSGEDRTIRALSFARHNDLDPE